MQRYWVIAPYGSKWPEYEKIWKYDLEHGVISIGWSALGDVSALEEDKLLKHYHRKIPGDTDAGAKICCRMLYNFYHEVKPGDKVIARKGVKKLVAVGTVKRAAYYDQQKHSELYRAVAQDDIFSNHLEVEWDDTPRDRQFDKVVFGMFTIYEITKDKFDEFTGGSPKIEPGTEKGDVEDQQEFILEKYLEDFIVANFRTIFKDELHIYETTDEGIVGQQFHTYDPAIGIIDILALDRSSNAFVVIELKKGRGADQVVGQTLKYMGWVRKKLCAEGQEVYGIIICKDYDDKLRLALSVVKNITVKRYQIDFKLLDQPE